jgi:hypothetical protein
MNPSKYINIVVADISLMMQARKLHELSSSVFYATLLANKTRFMDSTLNNIGYHLIKAWINVFFSGSVLNCLTSSTELWSTAHVFSPACFIKAFNYRPQPNESPEHSLTTILTSNPNYNPQREMSLFTIAYDTMRTIDNTFATRATLPLP